MWWKNVRLMVLLVVVIVFLVYLLVGFGCGLPGKSSSLELRHETTLTFFQLGAGVSVGENAHATVLRFWRSSDFHIFVVSYTADHALSPHPSISSILYCQSAPT